MSCMSVSKNWAAGRDVKAPLIGQRESHENRRDEPGVLAENVAAGGHRAAAVPSAGRS